MINTLFDASNYNKSNFIFTLNNQLLQHNKQIQLELLKNAMA